MNVSNQPKKLLPASELDIMPLSAACRLMSASQLMPGVGIWETMRQTMTRPSVMKIFLRSPGMRNAFEKPFIIDMLNNPSSYLEISVYCTKN